MDRKTFPWVVLIVFLLMISVPYIFAWTASDANTFFNGFLLNPVDGYSYLAKIEQGRSGSWLFQLPFTSDPNPGAPLFLYYLFLGHIAQIFGMNSLAIFHGARIINSVLLFLVLWKASQIFTGKAEKWVMAAVSLGGGLGWLILPWVSTPTDFWVAEAFPFLASYTNPHFPLAMALIVISFLQWKNMDTKFGTIKLFICALLLSFIQPFGVVIVVITIGLDWIILIIRERKATRSGILRLLAFFAGGLPYSIYLVILISNDPVLAEWNRQNVTPSPVFFDLLFSFSPGLLVIIAGLVYSIKKKIAFDRLLVIWVGVTIGLSFIPFNLQRRFLLSGYISVTFLAATLIYHFLDSSPAIGRFIKKAYLPLVLITPILILLIGSIGIYTKNSLIYINSYKDVAEGVAWLKQNALKTSIVFSDAQSGLYLPGMANVRVVYGHPFETPYAVQKKTSTDQCFAEGITTVCEQVIIAEDVNYVWLNLDNSEKLTKYLEKYRLVFESHAVSIYEID